MLKTVDFHLKPLPGSGIWTGSDESTRMTALKGTSLIGSMRFWTEALLRSFGHRVCDCTAQHEIFDKENYGKGQDGTVCAACHTFGCTGLARAFNIHVRAENPKFSEDKKKTFKVTVPGRGVSYYAFAQGWTEELTLALSWFCGPTGRVVSHEAREEFAKLARRNLDWAHVGDNVDINVRDVAEGFCVKNADALFLDVRTPWEYLDKAVEAVRPGAVFGFLLPTVMQVGELLKGLERGPFDHIEVQELLLRDWKPLADRLRPNDRMIAHTSFLVFCRHQKRNHDFDNLRPMGTREMKQKMALEKRLATLD